MNLGPALRGASLIAALFLAACGSSDDGGGLLDGDDGSGSSSKYDVLLDGPDCVEPGVTASGYTATVTTLSGAVAKNVFVAITAAAGTTSAGTIRATTPEGTTRLGGANTDTSGIVPFTYTPPSDAIRDSVAVTITAAVKVSDATVGTVDYPVELHPTTKPVVTVAGPKNASGVRQSSGSVTAASGALLPDFVATVSRPASGCGTGGRLSGASIAVTPTLASAAVRLVEDTSLIDGTAAFDYIAPTVTAATLDTLSVVATYNGVASDAATFRLTVAPPPDPDTTTITIAGPSTASASQTQTGYTALVQSVAADGTKLARPNTAINFTLSDGGTITPAANASGQIGVTDSFGKVTFTVAPKSSTTANQNITITAAADTTTDTTLKTSCALTGSVCSGTFKVTVQPDVFKFTAPVYGSSGTVGTPNAVALAMLWTTTGGAGVPGCVNLAATFSGSGTSTYLLEINGDPVPAAQTRQVQLGSDGAFQVPVKVLSDRSGFVQVTATENRTCGSGTSSGTLSATTGVQFVDEICTTTSDGRNCVDLQAPLRTLASPDASGNQRSVALSFTVLNSAYSPVDGAQVLFSVVSPAASGDPNERVFPGGGTTNANGVASSSYYVPTLSLASGQSVPVTVQACVRKNATSSDSASQVCSTRQIEIVGPD
ncbi:hypothetical protein [Hydrocarboniphaga sp.]|uniref:hypothetical protein n=1 Tax=Hydrocarboniphaga sp. TaxID=2033016 RepID=UPI003D11D083